MSYAITSALTHRLEAFIEDPTRDVWKLERRATGGHMGRIAALEARIPVDDRPLVADATDQMNRIRDLADDRGDRTAGRDRRGHVADHGTVVDPRFGPLVRPAG